MTVSQPEARRFSRNWACCSMACRVRSWIRRSKVYLTSMMLIVHRFRVSRGIGFLWRWNRGAYDTYVKGLPIPYIHISLFPIVQFLSPIAKGLTSISDPQQRVQAHLSNPKWIEAQVELRAAKGDSHHAYNQVLLSRESYSRQRAFLAISESPLIHLMASALHRGWSAVQCV